jgi:hypothetical protein
MTTLTYSGTLIVTSCWCGIALGVPSDLYQRAKRDHSKNIYCPLGHSFVYLGETEAAKEKRLRERAEDRLAAERARADGAEASLRATKGHVTRLRKRVLDGECGLCGRHLRDLARHVARVHPDETPEGGDR